MNALVNYNIDQGIHKIKKLLETKNRKRKMGLLFFSENMSLHIQAKDGEIEELALHVDELESKCMELESLVKLLEDRNLNSSYSV